MMVNIINVLEASSVLRKIGEHVKLTCCLFGENRSDGTFYYFWIG